MYKDVSAVSEKRDLVPCRLEAAATCRKVGHEHESCVRGNERVLTLTDRRTRRAFTRTLVGSSGRAVERRTVNRGDVGSIPPSAILKLRQFRSRYICLCLSEETLKANGPFYLVSMPGEVKDPTRGVNV